MLKKKTIRWIGAMLLWRYIKQAWREIRDDSDKQPGAEVTVTRTLTDSRAALSVTLHARLFSYGPTKKWLTVHDREGDRTWQVDLLDRKSQNSDTVFKFRPTETADSTDG